MYKLTNKESCISCVDIPQQKNLHTSGYLQPTYIDYDALYLYLRHFRSVYPPKIYSPTFTNVTEGPRLLHLEWNVLELHPWSVAR